MSWCTRPGSTARCCRSATSNDSIRPSWRPRPACIVRSYIEAVRASGFTGRSTDIGVVLDLMIHDIDLLLALVDSPLASVRAMGMAVLGRHEDVAQARLEFANGCVANLSASRVSYTTAPQRQMQVWSEQGFVAIDFGTRSANAVRPSEAVRRREFDYRGAAQATRRPASRIGCSRTLLQVEPLGGRDAKRLGRRAARFCRQRSWRTAAARDRRPGSRRGGRGRGDPALDPGRTPGTIATAGPIGPLAQPAPNILRGPHWHPAAQPRTGAA